MLPVCQGCWGGIQIIGPKQGNPVVGYAHYYHPSDLMDAGRTDAGRKDTGCYGECEDPRMQGWIGYSIQAKANASQPGGPLKWAGG